MAPCGPLGTINKSLWGGLHCRPRAPDHYVSTSLLHHPDITSQAQTQLWKMADKKCSRTIERPVMLLRTETSFNFTQILEPNDREFKPVEGSYMSSTNSMLAEQK